MGVMVFGMYSINSFEVSDLKDKVLNKINKSNLDEYSNFNNV